MKRRILLVDDEVAVLLTMKAVLEISGFDVDTAASAREGKHKLNARQYHMVITDLRMESDAAGAEVIQAARTAPYHPAVALLTAFPVSDEDWQGMGADKMLVKPMHTRILIQQIEKLFASHSAKLSKLAEQAAGTTSRSTDGGGRKSTPRKSKASDETSKSAAAPAGSKLSRSRKEAPGKKSAAGKRSAVEAPTR